MQKSIKFWFSWETKNKKPSNKIPSFRRGERFDDFGPSVVALNGSVARCFLAYAVGRVRPF